MLQVFVVVVETNVFSEVGNVVLSSWQVGGVVDWDVVDLLTSVVSNSVGLDVLDFLDDTGVKEVVWKDFVGWWNGDALRVMTLEDGDDESLDELTFVQVNASPGGGVEEGGVVLGTEENSRQEDDFLAESIDSWGEYSTFRLNISSVNSGSEVFHQVGVLIGLEVSFDVIGVSNSAEMIIGDFASQVF